MNKRWVALALLGATVLAIYAARDSIPGRQTPAQRQAEEDLRQRCQQARDVTQQSLTRYRAGNRDPLIEAARIVDALGPDEQRCSGAVKQVFDQARIEIDRLMDQAEWLVLNSEIELETVSALVAGWGTPARQEDWTEVRATLSMVITDGVPAVLNIFATLDGDPVCREPTQQLPEIQRTSFERTVLEGLSYSNDPTSARQRQRSLVMGRLANKRVAEGITPLAVDADFQFELFADTRPGTGMRAWIPGRLKLKLAYGDSPPVSFSFEGELPENISARIGSCDWDQAHELLGGLLATLPDDLIPGPR